MASGTRSPETSEGWQQVAFDLLPYAGDDVEISVTYLTDPSTAGVGAFVDDTRVVIDGVETADGFEGADSVWAQGEAPEGSPPSPAKWRIGEGVFAAGTATDDTLLLGFGLEQLSTDAERSDLMGKALDGLLD